MRLSLLIVFCCFLFISILSADPVIVNSDPKIFNKEKEIQYVIECRKVSENGLFSFLMRMVEWIYTIKHEKHLGFYINMTDAYHGFSGNVYTLLFKPFEDPQITTTLPESCPVHFNPNWPVDSGIFNTYYITAGFKNYSTCRYVYSQAAFCTDPDFSLFRERLHPIISQYMQPATDLQKRIDALMGEMNRPLKDSELNDPNTQSKPNYKIGIHVRCMEHYKNCTKSPDEFLDDIERDVDLIMASHDPYNTSIYLATLLEPVVKRLSAKYNVVVCDMPRIPDVRGDWTVFADAHHVDKAREAIIDTWCLAHCDEFWGSSSNMTIFAGCLNPHLKIYMIPSLASYDGN